MRAIACSLRIGAHDAGRDHDVASALQQGAPVPVEMRDQLGGGEHRVVAQPARHRAGMPGLADALDHAVADIAANAGDDADRQFARDQHRALLDVQFDPGGEPLRHRAAARPLPRDRRRRRRRACIPSSVSPVSVLGAARSAGVRRPNSAREPDIGLAEARAFLAAQPVELDGAARLEAVAGKAAQDRKAGDHAGRAVEIAALRHRIEMRAAGEEGQGPVRCPPG